MRTRTADLRLAAVLLVGALLAGCQTTSSVRRDASRPTAVMHAVGEVPEEQLLDVGVEVFEPGEITEEDEEKRGLSEEVRKAEARFVPVHLKQTMQSTGHWGAVRVLPSESDSVDLLVTGEIIASDGEELVLRVTAVDATGREWFSREYRAAVSEFAYDEARRGERDPFQSLYNTIANDLVLEKVAMSPEQLAVVRNVSELRFAADLAPAAFDGYLIETDDDLRVVSRLPARDDPMIARVRRIRERDYMLVDTVNGHYDAYYADIWGPYLSFRKFRAEEAEQLRELEAKARARQALGIVAFAGAIALDVLVGGGNAAAARNLLLVGGAASFKSGLDLSAQTEIHVDALRELGTSFEAEAEPLVLDVEGETVRLTGSADVQYASWRKLLKDVYLQETGLEGLPASQVVAEPATTTPLAPAVQATPVAVPVAAPVAAPVVAGARGVPLPTLPPAAPAGGGRP